MFTVDEKIICIDNTPREYQINTRTLKKFDELKLYCEYTVYDSEITDDDDLDFYISLYEISGISFNINRFVTLKEYRKLKLKKLCSK